MAENVNVYIKLPSKLYKATPVQIELKTFHFDAKRMA